MSTPPDLRLLVASDRLELTPAVHRAIAQLSAVCHVDLTVARVDTGGDDAGTPAPIVEKLNAAINKGLKLPETQQSFNKIGFKTRPGSVQDFVARIKGDAEGWDSVIKLTGVKVD